MTGIPLVCSSSSLWAAITDTQTAFWCKLGLVLPHWASLTHPECLQPLQVPLTLASCFPAVDAVYISSAYTHCIVCHLLIVQGYVKLLCQCSRLTLIPLLMACVSRTTDGMPVNFTVEIATAILLHKLYLCQQGISGLHL